VCKQNERPENQNKKEQKQKNRKKSKVSKAILPPEKSEKAVQRLNAIPCKPTPRL